MKDIEGLQTATVSAGGLAFRVWAGPAGIRRLELPRLKGKAVKARPVSIDFGDVPPDARTRKHVEALAGFLSDLLSGIEPRKGPAVDLEGQPPFTAQVLREVERIPWGSVSCYGEVAARAGSPGSARAAGGAVGRNPVPLVVPCHRVVRADGGMGGWSGAPGWKEWLLDLEGFEPGC